MIQLDKITVSKFGNTLFEDFDFHLAARDNIVLQGNNGSGKTILLEVLAGKVHAQSGTVTYDFVDHSADWDTQYQQKNKNIHFIPSQALHDVLGYQPDLFYQQRYYSIGTEQVATVRAFMGERVAALEALNLPPTFHVSHLLDLELTRLSNGQIKKVIIVKQLLKGIPRLILFDYPFEGLDRESRRDLSNFIDHLHAAFGIQFIITDHHNELPLCINRRVGLERFCITRDERYKSNGHYSQDATPADKMQLKDPPHPVVEFRNVTIQYESRKILENFSWRINEGERWALTGRNGSGKTTLFSLIYADHPHAYSQPVFLFGRKRGTGESIWDIKSRINYLGPEQIHFMHETSLHMPARDYLLSRAVETTKIVLEQIARFFEVEDLLRMPLKALSSGQLQLLHLIVFFLSKKELLLLDEPFQFLDDHQKQKVNNYMASYLDSSTTLVLITHYDSDIKHWTEKRLHIDNGNQFL